MTETFDLIPNSDVLSMDKVATIEKITALLLNDRFKILLGNDSKLKAMVIDALATSKTYTNDTTDILEQQLMDIINTKANDIDVYHKTEIDTKITNANVTSASKWTNARTLSLGGHASGSVIVDGTTDMVLTVDIKRGVANGIAELDDTGKVPASQLPSYVDDVIERPTKADFPATGESGKIYVDITTNLTYRWSGSVYAEISQSLALGETASSAFRGDYGKIAYDHTSRTDNPHNTTKVQVGLGNVPNVTTNDQTPTYTEATTLAALTSGETLAISMSKLAKTVSSFIAHNSNTSNPHNVTKVQVGLGNAENTADSAKNVLSATKWTTPRALVVAGGVYGNVIIDGSANMLLQTTVKDNSHNHTSLTGDVTVVGNVYATGAIFDCPGMDVSVNILCDDDKNAILNVMGKGSQGTGMIFVGQNPNYGGGIEYNGDSAPETSGGGEDNIVLFRRNNGVSSWTARNSYANDDWEFRGGIKSQWEVKGKTLISTDGIIQLGSVAQAIYYYNGTATLPGYYTNKDLISFKGTGNSEDNMVIETGHGRFNQSVYVDKKLGINKFSMQYNATEDSIDFIYG